VFDEKKENHLTTLDDDDKIIMNGVESIV